MPATTLLTAAVVASPRATRGQGRRALKPPFGPSFWVATDDELAAVQPLRRRRGPASTAAGPYGKDVADHRGEGDTIGAASTANAGDAQSVPDWERHVRRYGGGGDNRTDARTGGRGAVAAVLTDSAEDVTTAGRAGRIAAAENRPLVLLVPLPRVGFTLDPVLLVRSFDRRDREATAIAARTLPTLRPGPAGLTHHVIPHRTRRAGTAAYAVRAHAERAGVAVLVAPRSMSPGLASGRYRVVLLPHTPVARPSREGDRDDPHPAWP